jgi:hypothetical protein
MFVNHIYEKELISKTYQELNSVENNFIFKWAKDLTRHFWKDDTQMAKKCMNQMEMKLNHEVSWYTC